MCVRALVLASDVVRVVQIVSIHPSSVCFKLAPPDWIVYHETLVTTKRFVREVSVIRAEWLAELAYVLAWRARARALHCR